MNPQEVINSAIPQPSLVNHLSHSCSNCSQKNTLFDWIGKFPVPWNQNSFHVIEVRFKGGRKGYFSNMNKLPLFIGDPVIVEVTGGHDLGYVSLTGELVRLQLKKNNINVNEDVKQIYRIASKYDIEKFNQSKELEISYLFKARKIAEELKMEMKISEVELQVDKKKITFFYSAEERVDFRELIKKFNESFGIKIEMRQISLRQEAGKLGGIGSCGRELCCSNWLSDFKTVSTNAARYQNLSITSNKLQGQCSRLKCCLNYELDMYIDALKDIPEINQNLETQQGDLVYVKTDVFNKTLWFSYKNEATWHPLPVQKVVEIMDLNKKGIKPDVPITKLVPEEKSDEVDYGVFEEYSITRMDHKKKKKRR